MLYVSSTAPVIFIREKLIFFIDPPPPPKVFLACTICNTTEVAPHNYLTFIAYEAVRIP